MKKHSILKVLLVVIMCVVSIFTFVACDTDSGNSGAVGDADGTTEEVPNKDSSDDDNQGGGNAGGSEIASSEAVAQMLDSMPLRGIVNFGGPAAAGMITPLLEILRAAIQ